MTAQTRDYARKEPMMKKGGPNTWRLYTDAPEGSIKRCLLFQAGEMFWGGYDHERREWYWYSQYGDGSEYAELVRPLGGLYWQIIEPPQP